MLYEGIFKHSKVGITVTSGNWTTGQILFRVLRKCLISLTNFESFNTKLVWEIKTHLKFHAELINIL